MSDGWQLSLGSPFISGVTEWPERFEYRVFSGQHMLQLCAKNLSAKAIESFHRAPMRLGLYISRGVIFVLFKIEGLYDWSDQAFSMGLVDPADRKLSPAVPDAHQVLSPVLVDCDTGLIRGIRVVTWLKNATELLDRALARKMDMPFDLAQPQAIIADVYRQYPQSKQLAKAALLLEKAGGQQ